MHLTLLQKIWLALTALGVFAPLALLIPWLNAADYSLPLMFHAWVNHPANASLTADLFIAGFSFFIWVGAETYHTKKWRHLWVLPLTLGVGLSAGLPLYLFLRSRQQQKPNT